MNKKYLAALLLLVSPFADAMETTVANPNSWDAEKYTANSSPQFVAAMKVLSRIQFNETDDVLDIGSGDGKVTREIANRVPRGMIKGIDSALGMVTKASHHNSDVPNLVFEHATITKYTSKQKFNYAFSLASFAWIKEQQQALLNIADVLKPGGKFVGGIAHEDSAYLRARFNIVNSPKWKDCFVGYEVPYYPLNEDKIKKLCEKAGLTVEIADRRECPYVFSSREGFIKFMAALPIQLDKVPQERQIEFFNDIIDDYIKEVPEKQKDDGSIELTLSGLFVVAKK